MQITKKDLPQSQLELTVEMTAEEFAPYIKKGAEELAKNVKIEGFRPGKATYEVLKQKVGEMTILEEGAHLAINKTSDEAIEKNTMERRAVGRPNVNITKLAPNNPLEYKVILSLLPTIALGKYKELKIKPEEAKLDEKELARALKDLQNMRAKEALVDRPAQAGDKIVVDIRLLLDKVQVENGQYNDLALIIGQEYFIPGFDDKIIGAKANEEREFALPYPADHHQKNLAGKMVNFIVKLKAVYSRELPELNDEFAGFFQMKTMAELENGLKDSLIVEKKRSSELKNESELISKIVDDAKFGDLPNEMVESEAKNMLAELEQSVVRQGGKFEDYLKHLKKSKDELLLEIMPNAVKRVKSALVIREIATIEKIEVEHEEIHKKMDELKVQYAGNKEVMKMIEEPGYHHYLENILTNEKVIAKLKDWNYARSGDQPKS